MALVPQKRWARVSLLVAVPALLTGLAALLLGQDTNWDLQNYHLYNPYAFREGRHTLDLMPAGSQSFFNPWLDLLYLETATLWDPRGAGFLLGVLQGSNFALVYLIAREVLPPPPPGIPRRARRYLRSSAPLTGHPPLYFLLAALGLLSVGFLSEIGTTMQDSVVSLFPLGALLLALRALHPDVRPQGRLARFLLAGLVAGAGCGLKPVAALQALGLCLAVLTLQGAFLEKLRLAFFFGIAVLAGIILVDGWWLHHVWELTGNPIFPQFNNFFGGEWATPESHKDVRFLPQSLPEKLLWPFLFTLDPYRVAEVPYEHVGWALLYALLITVGLQRLVLRLRHRKPGLPFSQAGRLLLAFFGFSYLLWMQMFSIYRYLLPLELLLPLLFFLAACALRNTPWLRTLALGSLLAVTFHGLRHMPVWERAPWHEELYRAERPPGLEEADAVFLMGQPLGWLVAALDVPVSFIQISPNFRVSEAYRRHGVALAKGAGELGVIFDPAVADAARTLRRLVLIGFHMNPEDCVPLRAWLGGTTFNYQYCPVKEGQ